MEKNHVHLLQKLKKRLRSLMFSSEVLYEKLTLPLKITALFYLLSKSEVHFPPPPPSTQPKVSFLWTHFPLILVLCSFTSACPSVCIQYISELTAAAVTPQFILTYMRTCATTYTTLVDIWNSLRW